MQSTDKFPGHMENISLQVYSHSTQNKEKVFETAIIDNQPINEQPRNRDYPGSRRPIPVSVIDENFSRTFNPVSGLDFLNDVDQLIIQQSVELADLVSNISSENRYTVKIPRGDTIYYATETSEGCQRTCCGSGRSFSMRLYDRTQQEAISLKRRLACGNCTFWCYLQKMEVWVPPGELVGTIVQTMSFRMKAIFNIYNRHEEIIYKIEGPSSFGCLLSKAQNFKVYTHDGLTQIGNIIYQWDQMQVSYNILLQMPSNITENRHKALLLGSAFLLQHPWSSFETVFSDGVTYLAHFFDFTDLTSRQAMQL